MLLACVTDLEDARVKRVFTFFLLQTIEFGQQLFLQPQHLGLVTSHFFDVGFVSRRALRRLRLIDLSLDLINLESEG